MKTYLSAIAFVCVVSLACSAQAQCCAGKAKGQPAAAQAGQGQTCQKDKNACGKNEQVAERARLLAASGAPLLQFKVGDQTTCCPKQAGEWIKNNDQTQVRYVVEYTDEAAALKAYQTALEEYLSQLGTVRFAVGDKCVNCPNEAASLAKETGGTVQYRVASFTFADRAQADQAAEAARSAADKPKMIYVVDGKEYTCDKEARQSCQAKAGETAGKTCEYKVGDTKTCCETAAKIELTCARIIAAHQALTAAAEQPLSAAPVVKEVAAGS
jgi:hypothetical protein